jgi:TonB family protein
VSFTLWRRWTLVGCLALISTAVCIAPLLSAGQQSSEIPRKVKTRVPPVYPDIARRMNISGVVRLAVTVAPNGTVKNIKAIGGHPLLVSAAEEAVKKWKFEPASEENSGVVELTFRPEQ